MIVRGHFAPLRQNRSLRSKYVKKQYKIAICSEPIFCAQAAVIVRGTFAPLRRNGRFSLFFYLGVLCCPTFCCPTPPGPFRDPFGHQKSFVFFGLSVLGPYFLCAGIGVGIPRRSLRTPTTLAQIVTRLRRLWGRISGFRDALRGHPLRLAEIFDFGAVTALAVPRPYFGIPDALRGPPPRFAQIVDFGAFPASAAPRPYFRIPVRPPRNPTQTR